MWSEGVWEIVGARQSPTKFLVSDEPVTFYNRRIFPSEVKFPGDIELDRVGTRTLFPLGPESCLIITHTELTRKPTLSPVQARNNARAYSTTMRYLGDIQFGREFEEGEVIRVNFILKSRATRYIAASNREWLYPERNIPISDWSKLDDDWFLMPNLDRVPFATGVLAGGEGFSWAQDEYGRHPGDPKYDDEKRRDREWATHQHFQRVWRQKRAGKSSGRTEDKF